MDGGRRRSGAGGSISETTEGGSAMRMNFIDMAKAYAKESNTSYKQAAADLSILSPTTYFDGGADITGTVGEFLAPCQEYRELVLAAHTEFENKPAIRKKYGTLHRFIENQLSKLKPHLVEQFAIKSTT